MAIKSIAAGQTGAEVREILNTTIQKVTEVSQQEEQTIPLTNTEIEQIFNQ